MSVLTEPSSGMYPVPAVCVEGTACYHQGACPRIWVKQDFLLRPDVYSDYWKLEKDDRGFVLKSNHWYGQRDALGNKKYRTFIWRVTGQHKVENNVDFWLAVWVD